MNLVILLFVVSIGLVFFLILSTRADQTGIAILLAIVACILSAMFVYIVMPALTAYAWIFFIALAVTCAGVLRRGLIAGDLIATSAVFSGIVVMVLLVLVAVIIGPALGAYQLYSLPHVSEGTNLSLISSEHIREVSQETAQWRADKVVGEIGYKVEVEHMNIQMIEGDLVWIAPLDYNGLWKAWVYGNEGTGGYAVIQAENSKAEVKLIKDIPMRFTQNAVFGYNLHRLIYMEYPNYYMGEHTFQLDAEGNPKWITMISNPAVMGVIGSVPVGIVITDPIYGVDEFYPMGRAPKWVQRVMDEKVTESYLSYWGAYKYGWWNTIFDQKDVLHPTGGLSIDETGGGEVRVSQSGDPDVYMVRGTDGKLYWFGSFTTVGKDTSMVGYMLTDLQTGDFEFYRTPSIYNDVGAAKNVQQNPEVAKVMGARVSQPIMYLIDGEEIWIMPVITQSGENVMMGVVRAKTGETYVAPKLNMALAQLRGQTTIDKPTSCTELIDKITLLLSELKQCTTC